MTNLTERWKKGELPNGEYWCLSICGDVDKLYCYQNSFWKYKTEDDYFGVPVEIKQVLAEVPSYDEWVSARKFMVAGINATDEIVKLKDLLKECVEYVKKDYDDYLTYTQSAIYQEINQVLGEE